MSSITDKYLNLLLSNINNNTPKGDPPGSLDGLNANDYAAAIYNEVVSIIKELKASGELSYDQNLDALGITAQILLETGNGKSSLASKYNNFGGIKATPSWKGETVLIPNSDGQVYWRVYPTVREGLLEKVKFFLPSNNPRYYKAGVLSAKNAAEHAKRVQKAGYAGTQQDYADRVIKIANELPDRFKKANKEYLENINWDEIGEPIDKKIVKDSTLKNYNLEQLNRWKGLTEVDKAGADIIKEYNERMGTTYNPSDAWSGLATSNLIMNYLGATNTDEAKVAGYRPSKSHSTYIRDAFKTNLDPMYQYNRYAAEPIDKSEYKIGDMLARPRDEYSKWNYEDLEKADAPYKSHADVVVDKGEDKDGEYIILAGGNISDTYKNKKVYIKDLGKENYKVHLVDQKRTPTQETQETQGTFKITPSKPQNPASIFIDPKLGFEAQGATTNLNNFSFSNPKTLIFDHSYYNDPRTEAEIKQDKAVDKFLSQPLKTSSMSNSRQYKTGGSINIKPENRGKFTAKANAAGMGVQAFANKVLGASEGTYSPSTRRQANFARNASKWKRNTGGFLNNTPPDPPVGSFEWYAQLSPEEIKNIKSDLHTLGAEYTAEKKHTEDVTKKALDIGMRLGRNPNVPGYWYDYGPVRGKELIGNPKDWEAINMGWINNPKSWIRNLASRDQYGNITYEQVWDEENQTYRDRLDPEGNRIPYYGPGYGCIGAVCGIYQTAGARAAEPYTTKGKEILQGDPIAIQTGNKVVTPRLLKSMGFYPTEKKPGAIGRKRATTDPSSVVGHSFIEGPELEGEGPIIIENPGVLSEGIKTSRYQYKPEFTNWYEYLGRLPQIEPRLETAYERYKALKSAERPVSLERPDLRSLSLSRSDDAVLNTRGPLVLPVDMIRKTPKKRRIFRKTS